jgi:hypothetical protein
MPFLTPFTWAACAALVERQHTRRQCQCTFPTLFLFYSLKPYLPFLRVLETSSLALSAVHSLLVPVVVTDPEDPRFDLEKLIAKWESS